MSFRRQTEVLQEAVQSEIELAVAMVFSFNVHEDNDFSVTWFRLG